MASRKFKFTESSFNAIWFDGEFTGLDYNKDKILQVACLVTDRHLNIIEECPEIVIHQPQEVLDSMNDWCKEHHYKSGLAEASLKSTISEEQADDMLLSFVQKHTPPGHCTLAGNTIYMDACFIKANLPKFYQHLHYRLIDVSTIKELVRRWYPTLKVPRKVGAHTALSDIKESLAELKFYKKTLFK